MFYLLKHILLLMPVIFKLKSNNLSFNEIMVLNALYVCLHAFSLHRESPDLDPGRQTPHLWGGSVTTGGRNFFDLTYCKKLRDEIVLRERTYRLRGKVEEISTIGYENWVLKLEITCTSRCHLSEDYDVSRYETSSCLGSLIRSRSQKREKKNWRQSFPICFLIHPNFRDEIHFKGVGLSHPKILNFLMWLKFAKF
jgi:hypothetical protein